MTLVGVARTVRLPLRIDMQDDSSYFPPVRPVTLRLQKANVRDDMLFVIGCQRCLVRRHIGDIGIYWRFFHMVVQQPVGAYACLVEQPNGIGRL